ncbi:MAG TPA: hypothetical protein DFI00_01540 [Rhodospirillaceae bacterium]|nr:hypothetical protein [Alphaproteobacteria bacterium]MBN53782.1 hypothetical protein [Alphaproteobacteria bacterium]OUT41749.1 MAG: hypothetical protein CBB62_05375 [Micavibrio sp. TMED2]HCI45955.1 hypothetical protein [Rhodospirillaceae bacterium]|tara:strand:- start:155 stop:349 length:195 start_codon:yes stop_codon:yes gene_type:complete
MTAPSAPDMPNRGKIARRALLFTALSGVALTLAACGKRPGSLKIPPQDNGVVSRNSYPPQEDDL